MRILFGSDFHGTIFQIVSFFNAVRYIRADLVLLGGDYLPRRGHGKRAILILGNADFAALIPAFREELAKISRPDRPIRLLINERVVLPSAHPGPTCPDLEITGMSYVPMMGHHLKDWQALDLPTTDVDIPTSEYPPPNTTFEAVTQRHAVVAPPSSRRGPPAVFTAADLDGGVVSVREGSQYQIVGVTRYREACLAQGRVIESTLAAIFKSPVEGAPPSAAAPLRLWVSHAPARGLLDFSRHGGPVGSVALRRAIPAHKPHMLFTGHIHEAVAFADRTLARVGWTSDPDSPPPAGPAATLGDLAVLSADGYLLEGCPPAETPAEATGEWPAATFCYSSGNRNGEGQPLVCVLVDTARPERPHLVVVSPRTRSQAQPQPAAPPRPAAN
ncbi:hypothetical protein PAPYR_1092 [Paratrimastix pyriformis]|uniref:Calcineurin-like phosphoesterase domain-containing protein n=1 Tax=Paratrimastix pyriformis TaxID=342808 RepID=A0ABQ8V057_9EUKA|nr:hypothetical protein PAPYR_1092 [Paratrimastix pyriformis]